MRQWPAIVSAVPLRPDDAPAFAFVGRDLAAAVGGRVLREGDRPIRGAAVDSRRVGPGMAFYALPGERTDGHRFLAEALRAGAAALVVRAIPDDPGLAE